MPSICNRCRRGSPMFVGWNVNPVTSKVTQEYRCFTCGQPLTREISPHQVDLDDPRVENAAIYNRFWERKLGLTE